MIHPNMCIIFLTCTGREKKVLSIVDISVMNIDLVWIFFSSQIFSTELRKTLLWIQDPWGKIAGHLIIPNV